MSKREKKEGFITWQVSSRLSHTPHRDMLGFFSTCCSQECIVLELREVFRAGKRDKNLPLARVKQNECEQQKRSEQFLNRFRE